MKQRIFIKIGGSYITDKTRPDSLKEDRVKKLVKAISKVHSSDRFEMIIAHGAGAYGHIQAEKYNAQSGTHPEYEWQAFYQIRMDMATMNLRLIKLAYEQGLKLITIQPSAIIRASEGTVKFISLETIMMLLRYGQIPVVHGDIVVDDVQGFTIASTENILSAMVTKLKMDRVIMISDVPGVLDEQNRVIERIDGKNILEIGSKVGGARGSDVTGGMKKKIYELYDMIKKGHAHKAYILSCQFTVKDLENALYGRMAPGTIITK